MGKSWGNVTKKRCLTPAGGVDYNVISMQRKIIRVGTSAAVIIPKDVLAAEHMKIGDLVYFSVSKRLHDGGKQEIDPAIFEITAKLRKRYKPLLDKLVHS